MKSVYLFVVVFFKFQCFDAATVAKLVMDDVEISYMDQRFINVSVKISNYNATSKRIVYAVIWKINIPNDARVVVTAKKWVKNDYKLTIFTMDRRLKQVMESDNFGIGDLLERSRPPAKWPLQQNVPYVITDWYFDGSKIPLNLPDGKWLVEQSYKFSNKTIISTVLFKMVLEYV